MSTPRRDNHRPRSSKLRRIEAIALGGLRFKLFRPVVRLGITYEETLVYSYLCHLDVRGRAGGIREMERVTGLHHKTLEARLGRLLGLGLVVKTTDGWRPEVPDMGYFRKLKSPHPEGHWSREYSYDWFLPHRDLTCTQRLIYSRLLAGWDWVSIKRVAEDLGIRRETVSDALPRLARLGLVYLTGRVDKDGRRQISMISPPDRSGFLAADGSVAPRATKNLRMVREPKAATGPEPDPPVQERPAPPRCEPTSYQGYFNGEGKTAEEIHALEARVLFFDNPFMQARYKELLPMRIAVGCRDFLAALYRAEEADRLDADGTRRHWYRRLQGELEGRLGRRLV